MSSANSNQLPPEEIARILMVRDLRPFMTLPEAWMNTPHPRLGGKKPDDLIGTKQYVLDDLIAAIKYGIYA